jgi:hypothetical protein
MAIRLLGHFWRVAEPTSGGEVRRRTNDWAVELLDPSQWNPGSLGPAVAAPPRNEPRPVDPIWPETQPWCHD